MKCGYCGKLLKDDAQFCSNCGRNLQEFDDEPSVSAETARNAYAFSVLALILVIAIVSLGGFIMIHRDLHPDTAVSSSDKGSENFNYDSAVADAALAGKWLCTDRAAADYSEKNFGVEVRVLLGLSADGTFTLDYSMTDTGVEAKMLSTSGTYTTENGVITFVPDEVAAASDYIKRHGKKPAFPYTVNEGKFTLKYENGKTIVFKQVKE